MDLGASLSNFSLADRDLLFKPLHLTAVVRNCCRFLVPWCLFYFFDNSTHLLVLVLEVLETVLLSAIFTYELLHSGLVLNVDQVPLQVQRVLVDEAQELLANTHNHIPNVILPPTEVVDCICILLDSFLGLFAD